TLTVTVPASPPMFTITPASQSITVTRRSSTSDTLTIALVSGTAASVALSASGQERNVSVSFSPASVTPTGNSILTVTASRKASATTFYLTITGTASGATPVKTTVSV